MRCVNQKQLLGAGLQQSSRLAAWATFNSGGEGRRGKAAGQQGEERTGHVGERRDVGNGGLMGRRGCVCVHI